MVSSLTFLISDQPKPWREPFKHLGSLCNCLLSSPLLWELLPHRRTCTSSPISLTQGDHWALPKFSLWWPGNSSGSEAILGVPSFAFHPSEINDRRCLFPISWELLFHIFVQLFFLLSVLSYFTQLSKYNSLYSILARNRSPTLLLLLILKLPPRQPLAGLPSRAFKLCPTQ